MSYDRYKEFLAAMDSKKLDDEVVKLRTRRDACVDQSTAWQAWNRMLEMALKARKGK